MASAARLLRLCSSFARISCRGSRSISSSLLPSPRRRLFTFSLPVPHSIVPRYPLVILRCLTTTSAEAVAVDAPPASAEEPPASPSHPWPEWESFLEKLRVKGYFEASTSAVPDGDDEGEGTNVLADMEFKRPKNACLKFSRDRYDIFSFLPREDIEVLVECGCPEIVRKSVNSSKRLRAHLKLDEEYVCDNCNLRGSCDRAYKVPAQDEGPRTVDVMRILLSYALRPQHLSGEGNSLVKEHAQNSARNLLSKFIMLSDTTIDPSIPKPVFNHTNPAAKPPNPDKVPQFGSRYSTSNVEMKRGDWLCPNCNFLNFARNVRCLECKECGPKSVESEKIEMKKGDWNCPKCEFMNFARNRRCHRCSEQRPLLELNPEQRSKLEYPGDWQCPSCYYINFSRNQVCKKCNCDRPRDEGGVQFDDHTWRSPAASTKIDSIKFGDTEDELEEDEDILPRSGENKFVVSKRATPAERRLTSARNRIRQ